MASASGRLHGHLMLVKELRPYQSEAFERAKPFEGFALFGEQRTGKTLVACALIDHHRPDRLLIVTVPKGIVVWEKEFHESLRFDIGWHCDYRVVHYSQLRNRKVRQKTYRWLQGGDRSMTIADESHLIKRRGSKQSRFVRNCGKRSKFKLALTGTPIAQGIQDAWAQFNFIRPTLFGKWEHFGNRYLIFHGKWKTKVVGERNLKSFNERFHRYSHRITLREARELAGLPGLKSRTRVIRVQLSDRTRTIYDELEREMRAVIPLRKKKLDTVTTRLVITKVMKLQQLTGGFVVADSEKVRKVGMEKLTELSRLIGSIPGKVVIVSRFLHEIRAIRLMCETSLGKSVQVIAGGTEWTGQMQTDVAILQIQSGSAIDLSAADSIIFFSWDYSYINHEQTKFRILSYAKSRVDYYWLLAVDSIDELIYDDVAGKEELANRVCDHYRRNPNVG